MGKKKIYKVERENNFPKCHDPNCIPWVFENTDTHEVQLVSFLEKSTELKEKPEFQVLIIKPGEKKLLPHAYFTIHCEKSSGKFLAHTAPKGSNFIYEKKTKLVW